MRRASWDVMMVVGVTLFQLFPPPAVPVLTAADPVILEFDSPLFILRPSDNTRPQSRDSEAIALLRTSGRPRRGSQVPEQRPGAHSRPSLLGPHFTVPLGVSPVLGEGGSGQEGEAAAPAARSAGLPGYRESLQH